MSETVVVEKEMASTHADIFRYLPKALEGQAYDIQGTEIVVENGDRRMIISLGPEGERRIALLSVPATKVTLSFFGYDDASRRIALEKFDRAYQRGGG